MGKRGPAPQPTNLRLIKGNPGHRKINRNEPRPQECISEKPPTWLSPKAKKEWKRIRPELEKLGLLKSIDEAAFVSYCEAYASFQDATKFIRKNGTCYDLPQYDAKRRDADGNPVLLGTYRQQYPEVSIRNRAMQQIRAFAAEFGLTPSARGRIEIPKQPEKDPYEEFREEKQGEKVRTG